MVHSLVEHTSIDPNKAAHIGHLRNAILGDTFVRLLRAAGQKVDVQNYIDNTGVQVADVVVGFLHLLGNSAAEVRQLLEELKSKGERIDFYCWDLYARTSQWYTSGTEMENEGRKKLRYATLHEIEHGGNETAEIAELVSTAVLRRHLETMLRLDIEYDFLPRESEILHLKFWEAAFEKLKKTGVLYFENEGKNKGCWVMTRPGADVTEGETRRRRQSDRPLQWNSNICRQGYCLSLMEVRAAGKGFRLQAVFHLSQSMSAGFLLKKARRIIRNLVERRRFIT